jgi:hypothetical protein
VVPETPSTTRIPSLLFPSSSRARLDITARMPMIIAGLVYRIPEIEIKFYLRKAHEITQRFGLFSLSR